MINSDLYNIRQGIEKCATLVNLDNIDFAFILSEIGQEVNKKIDVINNAREKVPDDYKEYLKEKNKLDMKYSIQKEDGTIQTLDNNVIVRNPIEYQENLEILNIKYKKVIDKVTEINDKFLEFLKKDCDIKLPKLKKSLLPTSMNVEQMRLLFTVIEK